MGHPIYSRRSGAEALPVLTLGIYSKGQVRTRWDGEHVTTVSNSKASCFDIGPLAHNVSFWIQKLIHNVSFWMVNQKVTFYVSFWVQKLI